MATPTTTVIRNDMPATIDAVGIVPGDVVILEIRRVVPADMRLIETLKDWKLLIVVFSIELTREWLPMA